MEIQKIVVLGVFISLIGALVTTHIRPVFLFACALVALLVTDSVSFEQVLKNATNTGVVTLLLLLIASAAIEKTLLLKRAGRYLITQSYSPSFWRTYITTGLASAFLNNTAVVASLLSTITTNPHHPASRLLIPVSYAAILGGTATLIGTSTNLIVNSLLIAEGATPFGFFDFTVFGVAVFMVCGVLLFFLTPLLPRHEKRNKPSKDYFIEFEVEPDSPLCGKSIAENGLRHLGSLFLVEIDRNGRLIGPVTPTEIIQPGDKLIFSGEVNDIHQLDQFKGLRTFSDSKGLLRENLKEVVISNNSVLVGKTLKTVGFRSLFDAAVVAIHRDGEQLSGKLGSIRLEAGDNLILAIGDDFSTRKNIARNFFIVSDISFPAKLSGWQELMAIAGFITAVAVAMLGLIPLFESVFYLIALFALTGTLTTDEIKQRLPFDLWTILVGALSLATALGQSGLLADFGGWLKLYASDLSPFFALVVVYLSTLLLTELVTNNAAAALAFPIAFGIARGLEANVEPFVMAVALAASASFITPYGYQTNLMVFNAGRYHIRDFMRMGLPVSLLYTITVLVLLPVVFPLKMAIS